MHGDGYQLNVGADSFRLDFFSLFDFFIRKLFFIVSYAISELSESEDVICPRSNRYKIEIVLF